MHPRAEPDLVQQVHRRLLEHARAHALLHVVAVARARSRPTRCPAAPAGGASISPAGPPPTIATWVRIRRRAYLIPFAFRTSVLYANTRRDHIPRRRRRRPGPRRGHGRAGGLHPPDPGRRRAGDHPPAQARPDAGADDPGHRLRPADRRRLRAQADLLLGRQPGRRLAAPLPRRGAERTTLEIEEHSHAGMANRYVAAASHLPFAVHARLQRHVAARAHGHDQADHLPVHRRAADRGPGARPRRRDHPRPAGRPRGQRPALGPGRRAEGGRARRQAQRSSRSRRSSTSSSPARTASCCRAGSSRASPTSPAARSRPTRRTTTTATTRPTRTGTRSARTASSSPPGWRTLMSYEADEMMSVAAARALTRRQRVLRRASGCRAPAPTSPGARTRPTSCSSTRRARSAPSRRGCRCRSATACWPRPPTRSSACPRCSTTGSSPAGSTSASSARPRSTASPTSTRP